MALNKAAGANINMNSPADINALLGGIVDRKKWYWYDTFKATAGTTFVTTPYNFFAVPLGNQDPNNASAVKTLLETNINPPGGQFTNPYDCVLTNLGYLFAPDNTMYDITQVWKYSYLEFKILEKRFFLGHIWRHPPGAGLAGMSTQSAESSWTNGVPSPGQIYYFGQWSKYIPPLTGFTSTLTFSQTVGMAYAGSNSATLGALATSYAQSASALPTLRTVGQGGNGVWLIHFMNGLSDGPVQ